MAKFMKVTKEQLEGNRVKLSFKVGAEETDRAINQAYRQMVKEVNVPGFRKGKVPKKVLQARYGKNIFDQDAIEIMFPEAYRQAVEETDIDPIAQPVLEDYNIEEGVGSSFTIEVEVKPEVKLGKYTGLDLIKEVEEVKEEEIDSRLEQLRERMAQLVPAERDEVRENDYVIIDFTGRLAGQEEPFEGGTAEDYSLQVGSGTFVPGFEEQLIGAKVGEDINVEVTFPEDYHQEDLSGKDAFFKVKIKEIKVKQLPELDDEFARDIGDFESLEDLKKQIRENLEEQKERQADSLFQKKLFEKIAEEVEVDIPETMIKNEQELMFKDYSWRLRQNGIDINQFLDHLGTSKEEWLEGQREVAEKRVRNNLILEAITKEEGIEVSEEEVNDKIKESAEKNNQDPEKLIQRMKQNGTFEDIKYSMILDKTMDFLFQKNIKETVKVEKLQKDEPGMSEEEVSEEE